MSPTAIYGRDAELEQLRQLVSRRRSFLLHGPAGVGKTLLLKTLIAEFPTVLYCGESSGSQAVFRKLATELFSKNNRCVLQACGRSGANAIKGKSAVALRGIVTEALREGNYSVVLDHLNSPSQSFATALKEGCSSSKTPLIAVAHSVHMEDVGFLLPMFPERADKYCLRNFDLDKARRFAIEMALKMGLQVINQQEAIERIVGYSKGNPGAIQAMVEMACNPKYVAEQQVKLSPLYIDFRFRWGATNG